MKRLLQAGVAAAALMTITTPAFAHNGIDHSAEGDSAADEGPRADGHGPAGVMGDHVHEAGEVMVGLRLMRESYGGANRAGTEELTATELADRGFMSATKSMTMDMAMLDLMYAPTDRLTLMVMPQYMRMDMVMEGLPMTAGNMGSGMGGHGGHMMMPGQQHEHSVEGFGDTQVSALYSLVNRPGLKAHAALGVSVPTGAVDLRKADGSFVHYGMQLGSGTWDVMPSATVVAGSGPVKAGAQVGYVWRTEKENASGFSFGDKLMATAWTSYTFAPELSGSLRAIYRDEGAIEGHYNDTHSHGSPPDFQANYGGKQVDLGIGFNMLPFKGSMRGVRLGVEVEVPIHQDLNGVQLPRQWSLDFSLSKAF